MEKCIDIKIRYVHVKKTCLKNSDPLVYWYLRLLKGSVTDVLFVPRSQFEKQTANFYFLSRC